MRALLLYITLSLVLISSCRKDSIPNFQDDGSGNLYGTWKLVSKENYVTNQVSYKDPNDVQPYCNSSRPCDIIFTLAPGSAKDILNGHTITNVVSGQFTFSRATRQFEISTFGGTKVGEPFWSYNVWDNMYLIETYKVNNTQLRLYFDNGRQSLTFERL